MTDTLATIALAAATLLAVLAICLTEPGGITRYRASCRYHRDGKARHARRDEADALATIPDAREFARTV